MSKQPLVDPVNGAPVTGVQYFVSYVSVVPLPPSNSPTNFFGNMWLTVPTPLDQPEKLAMLEARIVEQTQCMSAHVISFQEIKKPSKLVI